MGLYQHPLLMDGAMGTQLMGHGFPLGTRFEELNESRPDLILDIHQSYIEAGAGTIVTNTFQAGDQEKFNRLGVRLAREAAAGRVKVFASIGPRGEKSDFLQQVRALERENPDGYLVETMISWDEAETAARAVRKISDRTLIVSFVPSLKEGLEVNLQRLRKIGVNIIGANCGTHPKEVFYFLSDLQKYDPGPWMARPAGGIPTRPVSPKEFATWGSKIVKLGVAYVGGCCGTTPEHIRLLCTKVTTD